MSADQQRRAATVLPTMLGPATLACAAIAILTFAGAVMFAGAAMARHKHVSSPSLHQRTTPLLPASPSAPLAVRPQLTQSRGRATLTFELSSGVAASAFVLADPDRVVIDLPEVNFQVDPTDGMRLPGRSEDLVSAYRVGLFALGRSRIVIDLRAPARVVKLATTAADKGRSAHLAIELAQTDAASFRRAARLAAETEAARTAARSASLTPAVRSDNTERTVIVLDPGHGGIDPGASGIDGAIEKDITLAFARALGAKLEASGRYRVVTTRADDIFVSLSDRLKIARTSHAALMVSIHCDTLTGNADVGGTTVYTVSDRASDAEAARIAESENKADLAGGSDTRNEDTGDVADILFDFTRRETRNYGHVFARTLVNFLKDKTKLNFHPQREAGFWVLKAPDVPSVLIELGYLSSPEDVEHLNSAPWREATADTMVKAIDNVFSAHPQAADKTATVAPLQRPDEIAGSTLRGSIPLTPAAPH